MYCLFGALSLFLSYHCFVLGHETQVYPEPGYPPFPNPKAIFEQLPYPELLAEV